MGLAHLSLLIGMTALCWSAVAPAQNRSPASSPAAVAKTTAARPHVVIYLIDTLRADHLGAYGYPRDSSPALNAFAAEAILFERAYTQASWTRASVGSLMTGRFPSRHGAVRREHRLRRDVATLPQLLQDAGYTTAGFISNPNLLPVFGFARGFDVYRDVDSKSRNTRAAAVHSAVFRFLDTAPSPPLFLYIHTLDPHIPYAPPPPYDSRFAAPDASQLEKSVAQYDGEIAYNDREFGELVARLRSEGIYDEALVIVLSDHGEEFMDHGDTGHGTTLFREQLHVPLLIRFPGGRHAGTRIRTPVRVMDLMPTILDELGEASPDGIDGQSFSELFSDDPKDTYRPVLFAEQDVDQHMLTSLTQGGYKIIRRHRPVPLRKVELYDLGQDPHETTDLFSQQGEVAERMLASLDALEGDVGGGTTIEFNNASALASRHRVQGSLAVIGGRFDRWEPGRLEKGDRIELDETGSQARFDLVLSNRKNPIISTILVDVDRLRFTLEPASARVSLKLSLDDETSDSFDILLGNAPRVGVQKMPFITRVDRAAMLTNAARPAAVLRRTLPFARVYTHPTPEAAVVIDPDLDARLRALGYTGDR